MNITFLGQAGLFVETRHGTILCDPFFNPAFFASWFPFPSNDGIDRRAIGNPDYLFISHLHRDHFDATFLRDHVSKDATVILPDFAIDTLENELRKLGFHDFVRTKSGDPFDMGKLRMMVLSMATPADGPLGDSALCIDDGETKVLNQNDSRPIDFDALHAFGPYDVHLLQFSGAIWYPMVYRYSEKEMREVGKKKRDNEMARAVRYIEQIKATYVIPSAGPAAFLDDELFHLNDFDRDPSNTFPDQATFVDYMRDKGHESGRVMIPGSVMKLGRSVRDARDAAGADGACEVTHPISAGELHDIFHDKRRYLEGYKARKQPLIDAIKATWPRGKVDILASLRAWFEPLLALGDLTCVGVNSRVLIDCGEGQLDGRVVIDFQKRRVYAFAGEECDYAFFVDRSLVEYCILHHEEDWVNTLFLSCRFEAQRKGPFNEYVYGFFKTLSPARLAVAEAYYAEKAPAQQQLMELDGHVVQRRCPHLKVDLAKFGHVENGVLTCSLHGWQFEVASGRCLTSDGYRLYSRAIDPMEKGRRRRGLEVYDPAPGESPSVPAIPAMEEAIAEAPCSEVKLVVPKKKRLRKSA